MPPQLNTSLTEKLEKFYGFDHSSNPNLLKPSDCSCSFSDLQLKEILLHYFIYFLQVRSQLATKIALWDINKEYQLTSRGMFFKKYFLFGITMFLQNIVLETQRVVHFLSIILFGNFLQQEKVGFISHGAKINTAVQKLSPCGHSMKFISGEQKSFKTT